MINPINTGLLLSDLNADTFNVNNCRNLLGADNVISSLNPRMSDNRNIVDGSVYDWSVADNAAITQSKLSLNGTIPTEWLGTTDTTTAEGDLVQFKSEKDQPNGYASLGINGKLPTGMTPVAGVGTVTKIDFAFPYQFTVIPDVETSDKSFAVSWNAEPPFSWFGNAKIITDKPQFNITPFPISLLPSLDAAQFTTGTFDTKRLPLAVGVGVGHASGLIPVSGGFDGLKTDYLARDMTFKSMETPMSYQPILPDSAITLLYYSGPVGIVTVTNKVNGTNLFYKLSPDASNAFSQIKTPLIQVPIGTTIMAYASKIGWNNSNVVNYTVNDPGT